MHNPPPVFVGNFRTSSVIPVSGMVTQEGTVCMNIYDLSLCLYVYICTHHEFAWQGFVSQKCNRKPEFFMPFGMSCL